MRAWSLVGAVLLASAAAAQEGGRAARADGIPVAMAEPEGAIATPTVAPPPPYERGVIAADAGDLARAIPAFQEALRVEVGSERAQRALAYALALAGRLEEAERVWHGLASTTPEDPLALEGLATVRALRGDTDGARRIFARLVVADERSVAGWLGLGRTLLALGDADQGGEALERALALGASPELVESARQHRASASARAGGRESR